MATQVGLKLADYVVTEADLELIGAEKFFDIKCRKAGLQPSSRLLSVQYEYSKCTEWLGGLRKENG